MYAFMLSVALAFYLGGAFADLPRAKSAKTSNCAAIDVPFCKSLGYQTTEDANQEARAGLANLSSIASFTHVESLNCSRDLAFMLCLYHLPICLGPQVVLKPCRGFCETVQASCRSQIAALNAAWLLNVNCRDLPQFHKDACINSRTAIDNSTSVQPATTVKPTTPQILKLSKCHGKNKTDRPPLLQGPMCNSDGSFASKQCLEYPYGCRCVDSNGDIVRGSIQAPANESFPCPCKCPACTCAKNRSKLNQNSYREGRYDFAIKARVLRISERKGDDGSVTTVISVRVDKIWRNGMIVPIKEGKRITLRYNATCLCPSMEINKDYIICGFEDAERRSLVVTQDGAVETYHDKFLNRIRKWEERIQNRERRMRRLTKKKPRSR